MAPDQPAVRSQIRLFPVALAFDSICRLLWHFCDHTYVQWLNFLLWMYSELILILQNALKRLFFLPSPSLTDRQQHNTSQGDYNENAVRWRTVMVKQQVNINQSLVAAVDRHKNPPAANILSWGVGIKYSLTGGGALQYWDICMMRGY